MLHYFGVMFVTMMMFCVCVYDTFYILVLIIGTRHKTLIMWLYTVFTTCVLWWFQYIIKVKKEMLIFDIIYIFFFN